MNLTTRDCQGDKTDNCNVVNFNFVTFSGGFGSVSIGERFELMFSRMTASVPTAEPDGAVFQNFYIQMVPMYMVVLMNKIMQIIQ